LIFNRKYSLVQSELLKVNKKLEILTPSYFNDILDIPEGKRKPLSYFENLLRISIIEGNCKLQIPVSHDEEFYLNSSFMKSLGDNPKEILERGKLLYENKKSSRDR